MSVEAMLVEAMSITLVTGALAPYTQRLYDAFAASTGVDLTVLVCETVEPQRQWVLPKPAHFKVEVLPGLRRHVSYTRHIYFNPSVIPALRRLKPATLIVEDFSPTMVIAALYARAASIPYGLKTDGHRGIDPGETSRIHKAMRRVLVPHARFGICASEDSVAFLEHWGLARGRGIVVPIVTPWDAPNVVPGFADRPFDILFAGGINEHIKGALFFADVVEHLAKTSSRKLRVRVTGDGPLRDTLAARLVAAGVDAQFDGHRQASEMPAIFMSAKVLLFPSRGDAWGLVTNEAALCGTPVLGSPAAISSKRLVEAFGIGLMRPMTVDGWADAAADILSTPERWTTFARQRDTVIEQFSLSQSVKELSAALASAHPSVTSARATPSIAAGR
jgi:glycosyltransferase involved in cell wall biosynthesis